jgi:predicted metal-dependent enzyme (double-stranded beta helix superfamily)
MTAAVPALGPAELGRIVGEIAASPHQWQPVVRFSAEHRWYYRLDDASPEAAYEVWLLSWLPGQRTGFHDHGDACGAFAIAAGDLAETTGRPGSAATRRRVLSAGAVRTFGKAHLHDVSNDTTRPAVSVHAYSPPLSLMRRYEMSGSGLVLAGNETAADGW